jgi:uncharacterized glyoxalase superfamily protein PhnB
MLQQPSLSISIALGGSDYPASTGANERRKEAFALYERAFGAKMISESVPPNGKDLHIFLSLKNVNILLGPGEPPEQVANNQMNLEMRYDDETAMRNAYSVLSEDCRQCELSGSFPWAKLLGIVTDKFGVQWALYYND